MLRQKSQHSHLLVGWKTPNKKVRPFIYPNTTKSWGPFLYSQLILIARFSPPGFVTILYVGEPFSDSSLTISISVRLNSMVSSSNQLVITSLLSNNGISLISVNGKVIGSPKSKSLTTQGHAQ